MAKETDLIKKLRFKADRPLYAIHLPADCRHLFDALEIKEKISKAQPVHQMVLFAHESVELAQAMARLADSILHETVFWICYPKKSGAIASDLIEMRGWDSVFSMGFRGQSSAAINDDWTAFRVTNAPRSKPSAAETPLEQRQHEGIDYVNRTAQLPADALAALNKYAGLADFFNAMSFTHKKEHILAINEAKKEETRLRRIEKMVEMLLKMRQEKELKTIAAMNKKTKK